MNGLRRVSAGDPTTAAVDSKELARLALLCRAELADESDATSVVLQVAAQALAREAGVTALLDGLRLFASPLRETEGPALEALGLRFATLPAEALGQLFELSLDATRRKRSGSYYTPRRLTEETTRAALSRLVEPDVAPTVCDPALGGGAFLLEAARQLERAHPRLSRRDIVERFLFGADANPLAVAVAEAALCLWARDPALEVGALRRHLVITDALERGWEKRVLPPGAQGFDLVLGNPPWVAYAGRAAEPLDPERRRELAASFQAFRGYPTLHAVFVERATELAPEGVVALVVPSPLADLEGYRPMRRAVARSHVPVEPLLEFGQDAFERVTQPCIAFVAVPGRGDEDGRAYQLAERQKQAGAAEPVAAPEVLKRVASLPSLPKELFGELGFQSAGEVTKRLFLRADAPDELHRVPLLEGREVREFHVGQPRLFLNPDPEILAAARCRLRPLEHYRRARFVVRQTAKYPIAALHSGVPFRNTLLAGYEHPELTSELAVALLNSTLYRSLHLASRRDARQAAFPQVKVLHLRALPAPPARPELHRSLEELTRKARAGMTAELRHQLDALVLDLFELTSEERESVLRFARARAPELGRGG